jgi:hypothetical protein
VFKNGDINYLIFNKVHLQIDGNYSSHTFPRLSNDSPFVAFLYATNKDEKIGRNHSLPGTRIKIPADKDKGIGCHKNVAQLKMLIILNG